MIPGALASVELAVALDHLEHPAVEVPLWASSAARSSGVLLFLFFAIVVLGEQLVVHVPDSPPELEQRLEHQLSRFRVLHESIVRTLGDSCKMALLGVVSNGLAAAQQPA